MKAFLQKNHRLVFFGLWILLGLMQAGLTELQDDEAYYWVYSRYLDWGYFDHPPMIAVLIKMGYAIFPNELGVRLFPLLLNVLTLVIVEKLIEKKNPLLFYGIALSMAVIQLMGFLAVPDTPLIFFTALFFLCYKRFVTNSSLLNTFLLGLAVACLFYSKYHAVLIVLFTLLSNIKLFAKYQTYFAGIIALLLFAPHLWWEYQHDWVSFKFHLLENNAHIYKPAYTIEYILGQLAFPGPIAGLIILPAAIFYTAKRKTEKALRYTMVGIYLFFLLSAFRGKVEANWTVPVMVPLLVLSHQSLLEKIKWQRLLFKLLPITLLLVLFARVVMVADILPLRAVKERYHAWKDWPAEMKKITKGMPVVFSNSYQRASKYWFYTGQFTYSQSSYTGRISNYNFWPIEDSLLGKPVYFMDIYDMQNYTDSVKTPLGWVGCKYDSSFLSFSKVQIEVSPKKYVIKEGESITMNCKFIIPPYYSSFIKSHPVLNDNTRLGVEDKTGWISYIMTPLTLQQMNTQPTASIQITPKLPKGKYLMRFAIKSGYSNASHNSERVRLIIE